ncbi:tRNA pseudouridine(38-40) synthase TruA [Neolewinella lacunae]|uniref:tRNA pseudouridine synthase A n=1 Tax=Neolewinella lacunae TaxID=1517758 RepID=A0A923TA76_9BACT|nr:tRNA pseudouridine(38-40) synthase TruA [Neolewinella lacunae]MBC6995863.1 tRNA pseudouridine(38-40) synthase TruA [Neolewinella lacunae]MDN3636444.1 tRNA pseudouridine(38-40) synthase TruA [Neolewinella lacunae]
MPGTCGRAHSKKNQRAIDYFLRLAYDGTAYRGWQRQLNSRQTVQEVLETALARIHGQALPAGACGRTDAGVHATQFYVHLTTPEPPPANYLFILNKHLPPDITVLELLPVGAGTHARFDATQRTYDYFFHGQTHALLNRYSALLDLTDFQPAALTENLQELVGTHDFRAFCKAPDRHNSTRCTLQSIQLYHNAGGNRYRLQFVADRFLRGMIRLLVSDLWRVGKAAQRTTDFSAMLATGVRTAPFLLAPAEGLFLTGVRYPYLNREPDLPTTAGEAWEAVIP